MQDCWVRQAELACQLGRREASRRGRAGWAAGGRDWAGGGGASRDRRALFFVGFQLQGAAEKNLACTCLVGAPRTPKASALRMNGW